MSRSEKAIRHHRKRKGGLNARGDREWRANPVGRFQWIGILHVLSISVRWEAVQHALANDHDHGIVTSGCDLEFRGDAQFPDIAWYASHGV